MADEQTSDQNPVFQIQRVYLKEASLEQPNSPQILLEQEQPAVDIQLGVDATPVADGIFEVCVTATMNAKNKQLAFMQGIQDKSIQIQGNTMLVMWFQGLMKYLMPRKAKPKAE